MNGWVTYNICELHYCENAKRNVGYNKPFFSCYSAGKLSIVYIFNLGGKIHTEEICSIINPFTFQPGDCAEFGCAG